MRRATAASVTAAVRRERENAAPRLKETVPQLASLVFVIEQRQAGFPQSEVVHKRYIVVDRAPAVFEMGCADRKCTGNHDFTELVLTALGNGDAEITGGQACTGETKEGPCELTLSFRGSAAYADSESDAA